MAPGELLYAALQANPQTAALLGGRIRPNQLEAGAALPAVVYQLVNQQPSARTRRACTLSDEARLQLTVYAAGYAQMSTVALAVRKALADTSFSFDSEGDQYDEAGQIGGRRQDYTIRIPSPL
ncbi:DUF3168 domain-containing protein [Hymenobacter guriensis]|uniref:DUF3168 domain-containing protein n=1 Tax=Hymenobacter guriensis TaxID=2793065 RepID=A0ABS0KWV5_9BACT|nr:DUF3168 domain-containing protein [Hymenobacter guriensis]MBG8552355.1 DUF3168 domain-containing protein [Hymenobacter guriensis]